MALLNERQQRARAIADELGRMQGVWVVSPLPLDNGSNFRVQILDGSYKNAVIQVLRDWGYAPIFVSLLPRVTPHGFVMAGIYEFDLPQERQPIINDRTIGGEISSSSKKSDAEIEGMRRYLGLDYREKKSK